MSLILIPQISGSVLPANVRTLMVLSLRVAERLAELAREMDAASAAVDLAHEEREEILNRRAAQQTGVFPPQY
jgi:hypothetical protein